MVATAMIGTASLGKVNSISIDHQSNIIPMPFPTKNSSETEVYDMFGRQKNITVNGVFTGLTSEINTAVSAINTIIGGQQTSTVALFVSTDTTTIVSANVMIISFRVDWSVEQPVANVANYSLTVVEGITR